MTIVCRLCTEFLTVETKVLRGTNVTNVIVFSYHISDQTAHAYAQIISEGDSLPMSY